MHYGSLSSCRQGWGPPPLIDFLPGSLKPTAQDSISSIQSPQPAPREKREIPRGVLLTLRGADPRSLSCAGNPQYTQWSTGQLCLCVPQTPQTQPSAIGSSPLNLLLLWSSLGGPHSWVPDMKLGPPAWTSRYILRIHPVAPQGLWAPSPEGLLLHLLLSILAALHRSELLLFTLQLLQWPPHWSPYFFSAPVHPLHPCQRDLRMALNHVIPVPETLQWLPKVSRTSCRFRSPLTRSPLPKSSHHPSLCKAHLVSRSCSLHPSRGSRSVLIHA